MSRKPQPPGEGPAPRPPRPRRGFGRAVRRTLFRILLLAVIVAGGLLAWNIYKEKRFDKDSLFARKNELSDTVVMEKLQSMGQLVTYSYEYKNIREIKDSRQIFGLNIPGTTHTIRLAYNGTIKVGFEVSEITVRVDNEEKVIRIALPEPKVTDNYIDMDNLSYAEQNNIFNPIRGEEITGELEGIRQEELEKATEAGIFELAEGNAKSQISGLLEAFEGYTVRFD